MIKFSLFNETENRRMKGEEKVTLQSSPRLISGQLKSLQLILFTLQTVYHIFS